jgi:hypothetical protein
LRFVVASAGCVFDMSATRVRLGMRVAGSMC